MDHPKRAPKVRWLFAAVGVVILGGGFWIANAASGGVVYSFPGAPTAPAPVAFSPLLSNFDVQVHSRDQSTWYQLEPMTAEHGSNCAAPPATHPLTGSYASAVFQCANHLMTSIQAGGYGEIVLTPNQMVDIGKGGTVSFDVSTERASTRDWIDLWITPYAQNLTLPFDEGAVDQQGIPRSGVHIKMDQFNGETVFRAYTIANFTETELNDCWWCTLPEQISPGTNQAATRQTFRLTLSRTHVRFEMLASATAKNTVWVDQAIPDIGFSQGVVQFAQHDYNPTKDNSCNVLAPDGSCETTWHWNNFAINPALPFSIIKATSRFANPSSPAVSFAQPANPNSMLRFSGIGKISVSFDGGKTFQLAQRQPSSGSVGANGDTYHPEHQSPFWTPIPAGATSATFRWAPDSWYSGPYIAQDLAIWSANSSTIAPTNTPTSAPTNTPTATATATSTPTQPPSLTPTATQAQAGSATVAGTILLEGRTNDSGVTISASPGGMSTTTAADGSFSLTGLTPGSTYSLTAAEPGYLDAVRSTVAAVAGTLPVPPVTLRAGDVNGDGQVTITDVSAVATDFGGPPRTGPTDLNGNGVVDIGDVSLVATNFGLSGPSAW